MADNESLSSIMAKLKKKREAIESNNVSAPKSADGEKETVEEIINSETAPAEEAAEANTEAAEAPEKANEENASESAVQTDTVDTADMFESSSAQSDAAPAVEENSNSGEDRLELLAELLNETEDRPAQESVTNAAYPDTEAAADNNESGSAFDELYTETAEGSREESPESDGNAEAESAPSASDTESETANGDSAGSENGDISDDLFNSLMDDIMSPSADEAGRYSEKASDNGDDGDDLFNSLISEIRDGSPNDTKPADSADDDNDMTTGERAAAEKGEVPAHADDDLLLAAFGYSADSRPSEAGADSAHQMPKSGQGAGLLKKPRGGTEGCDLDGAFAYEGREYRERSQKGGILNAYDREKRMMYIRLAGTVIFTVLLIIFDLAGKKFGGALNAASYPVVSIMVSLQLLLVCAVFSYKSIIKGVKGIISACPSPASVTSAVVILTVLYDILAAVAKPENGFMLYNSPAALCLLSGVIAEAGELFRQADNFRRMSSWESVCTLEPAGKKSDACGAYSLNRGSFAEGYFVHTNRVNSKYHVLNYVIAPACALALILMIITLAKKDSSFQKSLNVFIVTVQFSLPGFAALADFLPFFAFCFKSTSPSTVILHETDTADYESVKSAVLDETDMFGDGSLKIVRIRMCENSIDVYSVMTDTTAICGKVGGTISSAFRKIADETDGEETAGKNIVINRVVDGGIDAYVDGKHYIVGSVQFLSENNIVCKGCDDGRYIEVTPRGAVFHIAADGVELVRLYMEYTPGRSFTDLVDSFRGREINIELHCVDPNINDAFVSSMIGNSDVKISIVRETFVGNRERGKVDGGLLADGDDWLTILETAGLCSRYRNAAKLNFYIMAGFAGGSVLLALLLGLFGASVGISPLVIILIKILSVLPSVLIARLYLK